MVKRFIHRVLGLLLSKTTTVTTMDTTSDQRTELRVQKVALISRCVHRVMWSSSIRDIQHRTCVRAAATNHRNDDLETRLWRASESNEKCD